MEQLEFLEIELKMLLENIVRVKMYLKDEENKQYKPWNSHVFGELKHRSTALKQRLTLIQKVTTRNLFE